MIASGISSSTPAESRILERQDGTPIPTRTDLFHTFFYMKANNGWRVMRVLCSQPDARNFHRQIHQQIRHLAHALDEVRQQSWDSRLDDDEWDWFCGTGAWGLVDSMPIQGNRPVESQWQSAFFQGKYRKHITKIQAVGDKHGVPRFWSGPHLGTTSDIELWRRHGPPMGADECVLGDLAYIGSDEIITPYKRAPGQELDRKQKDYNVVFGCVS